MSVRVYRSGNPVHDYVLGAMCEQIGADLYDRYEASDVAVVFGVYKAAVQLSYLRGEVIARQKILGKKTIVIDSGYVRRGDAKDSYYSVGLNGLNGRADHRNKNCPSDRWDALGVELQPWRDGQYVLVCGQVPWDANVQHINYLEWVYNAIAEIKANTERDIMFRPHPKAPLEIRGVLPSTGKAIADDLAGAYLTVALNSNSLVDSVIAGVPVFGADSGNMVKDMYDSQFLSVAVKNPYKPDRTRWAYNLAYTQWRPDEMGEAFRRLTC